MPCGNGRTRLNLRCITTSEATEARELRSLDSAACDSQSMLC